MILTESNGYYSQTIRVYKDAVDVEVKINGELKFCGIATNVISNKTHLTFKDEFGNNHSFQKRNFITTT